MGGEDVPLCLPLGFGLSASGPPSRYALSQVLREVVEVIPNLAMTAGLVIPSSTTAMTAASLVSNEYVACFPPVMASTSIPTDL